MDRQLLAELYGLLNLLEGWAHDTGKASGIRNAYATSAELLLDVLNKFTTREITKQELDAMIARNGRN